MDTCCCTAPMNGTTGFRTKSSRNSSAKTKPGSKDCLRGEKRNLAARWNVQAKSSLAETVDSLRMGRLLNRRKPLADIWCSTSKRSKKPLPSRRAAPALRMAVQSKYGRWLTNVRSTCAHANWREKNSLRPFKPTTVNSQRSTTEYEHTKSEWIHAAVSRKRLDQEPIARGKTKSNRSMDGLVQAVIR